MSVIFYLMHMTRFQYDVFIYPEWSGPTINPPNIKHGFADIFFQGRGTLLH